jgi:hypothetical protein
MDHSLMLQKSRNKPLALVLFSGDKRFLGLLGQG